MRHEIACSKKNGGNGNGNGAHETLKPKIQNLSKEDIWCIRRDMPRPPKKETRTKTPNH